MNTHNNIEAIRSKFAAKFCTHAHQHYHPGNDDCRGGMTMDQLTRLVVAHSSLGQHRHARAALASLFGVGAWVPRVVAP